MMLVQRTLLAIASIMADERIDTVGTMGHQTYGEYRKVLLGGGWQPYPELPVTPCDTYLVWCADRPERIYCKLTGPEASCEWRWRKDSTVRTVFSAIDGDVLLDEIDSAP